jgi:hypothetical protein
LAYSEERVVVDDLAGRLRAVEADGDRVRELVALAVSRGFRFDD